MSFAAISSIASSALTATQVKMQVASSNIANADTAGYTQKTASQVATVTGGLTAGVEVSAITSAVDKYLLKNIADALGALGAATVSDNYADSLQNLLGSVSADDDTGTSLANTLASLETALSALAGTPESTTLRTQALSALDNVASQLRETASQIQGLRADADDSIATAVDTVNEQLASIDDLNQQIVLAQARGESTADLEDTRTTALQAIASEMNVTYYVTSDNQMKIYTGSGTPLLDSQVHELSYSPAAYVTVDTVFSAISVGGTDITAAVTSGTIGSLIDQRDAVLPAAQDEFDNLAASMIATFNAVYNQSTSLPAPTSLTSSAGVSGSDVLSGSGSVRIALVDDTGTLLSYADFDLSAYSDVDDFIDAINATSGLSASIDGQGHFTIASTDGSGVAVADIDSQIDGAGVSAHFGFNDLLTGSSATDIAVRSDLLASPGTLAMSSLDTEATLAAGASAVSVSSTLADELRNVLASNQSFGASGTVNAQYASFADYASLIVGGIASGADAASTSLATRQDAYQALADAFSSQTGVNVDEEMARISNLEQQYSTAAQLLEVLNSMFEALLSAVQ